MKCFSCGKEMEKVQIITPGFIKISMEYVWHCDCMPNNINVSVG